MFLQLLLGLMSNTISQQDLYLCTEVLVKDVVCLVSIVISVIIMKHLLCIMPPQVEKSNAQDIFQVVLSVGLGWCWVCLGYWFRQSIAKENVQPGIQGPVSENCSRIPGFGEATKHCLLLLPAPAICFSLAEFIFPLNKVTAATAWRLHLASKT